jgi:hypothetical protein
VVEAAGVSSIAMADITERYGVVTPLPETPASDEVLSDVAQYAAAFGDRGTRQNVTRG